MNSYYEADIMKSATHIPSFLYSFCIRQYPHLFTDVEP